MFSFRTGDNSDIVATDSQKNTVYLLAKKFGIKSPEDFALTLTKHFLSKYRHVKEAHVHVQEYPWERIRYAGVDNRPTQHNHAFVFTPVATRYCDVIHQRGKCLQLIFYIESNFHKSKKLFMFIRRRLPYFHFYSKLMESVFASNQL